MKYGKGGRKKTESSWRKTLKWRQIPGKKAAKAAQRQRHTEEARYQEEEAKWQVGGSSRLERHRRVDAWRRKRRGKGKIEA